eukprot:CAMPEP_0185588432 /NCGR_PEP_ID=MMETSP0434-20130131/53070_1 /TAXON_ID=626734 ORGANISM="Favella taraikaensis, Strain Fe Narragansett Bay" /NCGR_SAMPLE_ID=MMETSP0434 /ASSEMBLY_ACC=CAM_ASM_000379 /LENGTH=79 /DNA_ID=CAMNT_0028211099 /DNA_START=58 /DNA_END=297 /DNA_ORIENTATION=-
MTLEANGTKPFEYVEAGKGGYLPYEKNKPKQSIQGLLKLGKSLTKEGIQPKEDIVDYAANRIVPAVSITGKKAFKQQVP